MYHSGLAMASAAPTSSCKSLPHTLSPDMSPRTVSLSSSERPALGYSPENCARNKSRNQVDAQGTDAAQEGGSD